MYSCVVHSFVATNSLFSRVRCIALLTKTVLVGVCEGMEVLEAINLVGYFVVGVASCGETQHYYPCCQSCFTLLNLWSHEPPLTPFGDPPPFSPEQMVWIEHMIVNCQGQTSSTSWNRPQLANQFPHRHLPPIH